jgi:MFS transporter, MHS family, citrate/tricarballylate:H+ symporter
MNAAERDAGAEKATARSAPMARDVIAVTVGNALEFYDFLIYALFAVQIGHAFFPAANAYVSLMLSLATFGAGFLTRPIGALVLGAYADKVGRRPAMLLCLVMIGASMVAIAIVPPYALIGVTAPILAVLARLAQGFSLGGEVGANTAFLAEAALPERRGETVSWQGVSQLIALITGSLVGVALTSSLPAAALDVYGWRIAFLVGAVTVPVGYWLRGNLRETLHEGEAETLPARRIAGASPVESIEPGRRELARRHWRIIVLGLTIIAAGTVGTYILDYIATYAQSTLHMSARTGFIATLAGCTAGIPAVLLAGRLSDRYGRRPINVWCNLAFLVAIYPVFTWVNAARSATALILGVALLWVLSIGNFGTFCAAMTEALPQRIRSGAFGTAYATAIALFGGTTQLVVTWLIHLTGSAIAPAWYLTGCTLVGQIAYLLFPETAPVRLQSRPAVDCVRVGSPPA